MPRLEEDTDSDASDEREQITLSAETLWVWADRWSALVRGSAERAERFQVNLERYLRPQLEARDWREVEQGSERRTTTSEVMDEQAAADRGDASRP